jgi:indole-3-glycerol phosphate synthase
MSSAGLSSDFLQRMTVGSRQRLAAARALESEAALMRRIQDLPAAPALRLSQDGFDLIAEVKRRSPAAGRLAGSGMEPVRQARAYVTGGAAVLSILTEPERFDGSLADLAAVARAVPQVPAMRKDFLVHTYQLLEARAAGAGGVLLIAAMLDAPTLQDLLAAASELGLFALVECFDVRDLAHCLPVIEAARKTGEALDPPVLLGINCRDLRSLHVDFGRFADLAPHLPAHVPCVAESGVSSPEQASTVAGLGYRLALVGTALMQSGDPAEAVADLLRAGRGAVA